MHKVIFLALLGAGCAAGFMPSQAGMLTRRASAPALCLRMADERKGFGKEASKKEQSELAKDRAPVSESQCNHEFWLLRPGSETMRLGASNRPQLVTRS
jgi:hypothetical protein